jgi:hypothetical protein
MAPYGRFGGAFWVYRVRKREEMIKYRLIANDATQAGNIKAKNGVDRMSLMDRSGQCAAADKFGDRISKRISIFLI